MANFLMVIDPDDQRRSQFSTKIKPLIPPFPDLDTQTLSTHHFSVIWAASNHAPITWANDTQGISVIWGEAIDSLSYQQVSPDRLRTSWQFPIHGSSPAFNGFYAAATYTHGSGLVVGADLLGLYPIYYFACGEVLLVASSPELIQYYPLFQKKLNLSGLVGILLMNGLVGRETLWQEVYRLQPGHLLVWQPEKAVQEIQNTWFLNGRHDQDYAKLSFADQVELVASACDRSIAAMTSCPESYCLLLSGGLDSRMLAGFLQKQAVNFVTLTLGERQDLEMKCATAVARALEVRQTTKTLPYQEFPDYEDLMVKWEHLTNGGSSITEWGVVPRVSPLASRVITGCAMDPLGWLNFNVSDSPERIAFESVFNRINSWAVAPEQLKKLLRKEIFGDLVEEVLAQIRTLYVNYSDSEWGRAWGFHMYNRIRFHTGVMAWQMCFGAWSIFPILDYQLLNVTASLPVTTLEERRLQSELVCRYFPHLSSLPLDRNAFNIDPLTPTPAWNRLSYWHRLQRKIRYFQARRGCEQRYYYRMYDINNPGWQQIRSSAEMYREKALEFFDRDQLSEMLPSPQTQIQFKQDGIIEAGKCKTLLGFLLWAGVNC